MNLQGDREKVAEEIPPFTQLDYLDKEGEEYTLRVQGIMEGKEKEDIEMEMREKAKRVLGRGATIGDFSSRGKEGVGTRVATRASGRIRKGF